MSKGCGTFAVAALLLSILIIVELVCERYFFQRAITLQTELVTMFFVASTFIGSAYVLSEKAHVSMEWIYDFLSKKNIIRINILTSFISLIFFLFLFYFTSLMIDEAFVKNYTTGTVWSSPLWIPYSSLLIGALLMIFQYIAEILKLFRIVESINLDKEKKNLVKLKKALYYLKQSKKIEANNLIRQIIEEDSIWKDTALEISK